jgi:adenylate cyclase
MSGAAAYVPTDRRRALAQGQELPDRTMGAALFADISGFTALTEALTQELGARYGAEELTRHLNTVYDALIAVVNRFGGSVIGFSDDGVTCWFDESVVSGRLSVAPEQMPDAADEGPRTT